ncbi:MAG: hypothetical protein ABIQ18_00040 [Umezawaea sp.]
MPDFERELRSMADLAVPPSTSALDDVLRRGRRRVYLLRAGATAGVVAVVAGAGFTALGLRGNPTSLPPALDGPAVTTTTTVSQVVPWPKADLPAQVPYATWEPAATAPPGPERKVLAIPMCDSTWIDQVSELGAQPVSSAVVDVFGKAVGQVVKPATTGEQKTTTIQPTKPGGRVAYSRWIDVTDAGGTGSVTLDEGTYTGTPLAAADQEAFISGNCEPPTRKVMDDGTIVQYSSVSPSEPYQSLTQRLRIYHPNGVVVEITQRNYGSPDFRVNDDGTSFDRFGKGRETLPLSADQLAEIGEMVARVG